MTEKVWTKEEALQLALDYFGGDNLAADVFLKKYALRNAFGDILEPTPVYMHRRLAKEFARIEAKYVNGMSEDDIFDLFDRFRYVIPQGSPMSAIGNPYKIQSLSNCFVIEGPYDSYASIMRADHEEVEIMKRRGGVGFDLSRIRPKGVATANAAGTTDGIAVFMERYSNSCREVAQGGRRGALMLTIDVRHPEIETFINIKRDLKKVTGANISIKVTDAFMQAVKDDGEFTLQWPVESETPSVVRTVKAREIWNQVVDSAWASAEPGILFWDTVKRMTPADAYTSLGYGSISTNPCGEIVLSAYDACRLLLLNLASYVTDAYTTDAKFNFAKFDDHVIKAQRLMDDLVDLEIEAIDRIIAKINSDPEPEEEKAPELKLWQKIRSANVNARRTGLGITALGDTLAALGIKYGTAQSIDTTELIYKHLAMASHASSVIMAAERGAFPVHSHKLEKDHPFFEQLNSVSSVKIKTLYKKHGRRNICTTTTAPAGSTSTLSQTTSGIEPAIFAEYVRRRKLNPNDDSTKVDFIDELGDKWEEYRVFHQGVTRWMAVTGNTDVKQSPYYGATAEEIDPLASVDIQAAAQKWIEHSISKTCNLPEDVSKDVVTQVYMRAWEKGCKGFTVYRKNSRAGVLVEKSEKKAVATKDDEQPQNIIENHAPRRPRELPCDIHQVKISGESWTILVGRLDGHPYEVFGGLSQYIEIPRKWKAGKLQKNGKKDGLTTYNLSFGPEGEEMKIKDVISVFDNATHGAFTRTISLALRHGIPIQYIAEQLQKDKHSDMQSFSRVMARVLKTYIKDGTKSGESTCWSCGAKGSLVYQENCVRCVACGNSKCG